MPGQCLDNSSNPVYATQGMIAGIADKDGISGRDQPLWIVEERLLSSTITEADIADTIA